MARASCGARGTGAEGPITECQRWPPIGHCTSTCIGPSQCCTNHGLQKGEQRGRTLHDLSWYIASTQNAVSSIARVTSRDALEGQGAQPMPSHCLPDAKCEPQ